ncbi:delta-type opioid receptor-like [Paramacrobiotus metropolitanus]|uniref:delta-type opioid receptor-like n=1 Tax=Paramacrobiotus metropolitanus TaxID=2943436 RepID=UPI002446026B|nr:delta-type opioid receptor-like [Paramacrobiotus metropolitanus]
MFNTTVNFSVELSNGTTLSPQSRVVWPFDSIMTLTCSILMAILNSALAAIFLVKRDLRSAFASYLTALLLFNVLVSIHGFLYVIKSQYPVYMRSHRLCDFRLYVSWVVTGIPLNLHVLITINRIWAIAFPMSYRNHHSPRLAWMLVAAVTVYVHVVCLPGVVLDGIYYRMPVEKGCVINTLAQPRWNQTAMLLIFEFPVAFIGVSWIYLLAKQRRHRHSVGTIALVAMGTQVQDGPTPPRNENTGKMQSNRRRFSRGFVVFSALTLSAVLCWTPYETYYVIWAFVDLNETDQRFVMLCLGLYLIQPVLDPVLIVLTMPDLRRTIRGIFDKMKAVFTRS